MSTAIAEPPAPKAELPTLPPLEQAFGAALKAQESKPEPVKTEAPDAPATTTPEKPAEPAKPAEPKPEVVKTEKPGKKKSALDAALSQELAADAKPEADEVQQLLESKDPNWDKARETMKRQSEELKTFREKVAKASEPTPEVTAKIKAYETELQQLRESNAKMKDSIVALDVRFDPSTQETIQARESSVAKLSAAIKESGGNPEAFLDAMALPLNKRGAALDAVLEAITSPRSKAVIERKLAEIEVTDEKLDELLSKPQESLDQLARKREAEAQKHEQAVAEFKAATFDNVGKRLQKESPLFRMAPEDSEGADTFNADLKADMERAIELAGDVSPEAATVAAFKAQRFDTITKYMLSEAKAKDTRISELEESLRKFEGAEPGYRGGKKPSAPASHDVPIEQAYMDALKAQSPI